MSIRLYCDGCGKEMRGDEKNVARTTDAVAVKFYFREMARLKVGIVALVEGGATAGHVCINCAKKVINEGWTVAS